MAVLMRDKTEQAGPRQKYSAKPVASSVRHILYLPLLPRSRLTTGVQKRWGPETAQLIDAHFLSKPLRFPNILWLYQPF